MTGHPFIALLAAGAAARFGGGKLDAPVNETPLGRFALDSLRSLDLGVPTIIIGQAIPAFARAAQVAGEAKLAVNPQASAGIGTSVGLAARLAEQEGCDALLIALADMPALSPATLRALVAAVAPGRPSAVGYPGAGAGIPACFPADFYPQLQTLESDRGASAVLRQCATTQVLEVPAMELRDIDTLADLAVFADGAKPA